MTSAIYASSIVTQHLAWRATKAAEREDKIVSENPLAPSIARIINKALNTNREKAMTLNFQIKELVARVFSVWTRLVSELKKITKKYIYHERYYSYDILGIRWLVHKKLAKLSDYNNWLAYIISMMEVIHEHYLKDKHNYVVIITINWYLVINWSNAYDMWKRFIIIIIK